MKWFSSLLDAHSFTCKKSNASKGGTFGLVEDTAFATNVLQDASGCWTRQPCETQDAFVKQRLRGVEKEVSNCAEAGAAFREREASDDGCDNDGKWCQEPADSALLAH